MSIFGFSFIWGEGSLILRALLSKERKFGILFFDSKLSTIDFGLKSLIISPMKVPYFIFSQMLKDLCIPITFTELISFLNSNIGHPDENQLDVLL